MSIFDDVKKFMELGHPDKLSVVPRIPPESIEELCMELVKEEHRELTKAYVDEDLAGIADGIADSIWVLIAMAHCYGIPIEKVWEEVAKTNMAKFPKGVVVRDPKTGKVLKPPGWKPPNIGRIIAEAKIKYE